MKQNMMINAALMAVVSLGGMMTARGQIIYTEGFTTNSTVMAASPAAPTATSTDYAVLSSKNATGSSIGSTLDLTIGGTSSGLAEMQAIFSPTPVTLNEGETIRLKITFEAEYLMDGGDSYGSPGTQYICFGLYNSGDPQSYPIPGGLMANGVMGSGTDYPTGYAQGWKGYVGRIRNSTGGSSIYTREPQIGTDNENQDVVFADGVTGGYDNPREQVLGSGPGLNLPDGVYTMILDITKDSLVTVDQYLYEGTDGALVYSASGLDGTFRYDSFDALAFGFRGRANLTNAVIHLNVTDLEISIADLQTPSVTGLGNQSVYASQSLILKPVITGAAPLFIQWSSNSVALAGETNATLKLDLIQPAQDGTVYSVVATNELGAATNSMTLTVLPAPPATGLYNIQLNYGDGSSSYVGGAQIGGTNDLWNNPVWDGVGTLSSDLFSEYIVDTGGGNIFGVSATLSAFFNDGANWNSAGTFNHYTSRNDGSPNPVIMTRVVKVDFANALTLSLSSLPTNAACTVYMYGSGNKHESGYYCELAAANTNGGVASAMIMYDTNSVYAATGRDLTLATSQGLSWEVLSGTTDSSGNLVINIAPPGIGNSGSQIYTIGVQIQVEIPETSPTEEPVIQTFDLSGGTVTLSWTAQDIGSYSILRKTSLDDASWTTVVSNLPAGNLTTNVSSSGAAAEFYKIKGE